MGIVNGSNIIEEGRYIKNLERLEESNKLGFLKNNVSQSLIDTLQLKKSEISQTTKKVALVNAVWDMFHAGHVSYLERIEEKLMDLLGVDRDELYIIAGVESDDRVKERKGDERPFIGEEHRKIVINNQKQVDDAFIYPSFKEDRRPSDMGLYLKPDLLVIHEEHIDTKQKALSVYRKMKQGNIKLIIIRYKDELKYGGMKDFRQAGLSTTNLVNKIKEGETN